MIIAGVIVSYVVVSLLIAYHKYNEVVYEYYPGTIVPKIHKGNTNTCYGDVKQSLLIGFVMIPMWSLVIGSILVVASTIIIIIFSIVGIITGLFN